MTIPSRLVNTTTALVFADVVGSEPCFVSPVDGDDDCDGEGGGCDRGEGTFSGETKRNGLGGSGGGGGLAEDIL